MTHLAKHPRTAPGPVARATAIKWSHSLLDSRFHAIDGCCALVAGHGDDIDDAARDGATSGRRER
jgi:hypothetical protein